MSDAELRDAAVAKFAVELSELQKTTRGLKGFMPPANSAWGRALKARDEGLALLAQIGQAPPPPPPPSGRLWAANSPINTLIPASPTVILGYGQGALNGLSGIGFNGGGWGVGIFRDTSGSRRTIIANPGNWQLDNVPAPAQFAAYVNAMAALGDTERHAVIFDGFRAHNVYGTNAALTTAAAFGELDASGSGFWDNGPGPWLGRASGFCSAAGAVLKAELDAGDVPHALALGWPKERIAGPSWTTPNTFIDPATSSDGAGGTVKMGARLQLDPTLTDAQLRAFGISDYYLPVARAMQRYGAYVSDSTGWMTVYAESWNDAGRVNWTGGWHPGSQQLTSHLRWVQAPPATTYDSRMTFGQPHQ